MKVMVIETDRGTIVCSLATDAASGVATTVSHFEERANSGKYDGLKFHRVEDWVIQGGDPTGTGSGGGKMPAEYNRLPFNKGALGVARGPDRRLNSDCQFFIVKSDARFLDGDYTNFGQTIEGMDVVGKIRQGDRMNSVRVEEREG
jgi:cyclophilin family peptidyl-prolyl cis-trans isomerase